MSDFKLGLGTAPCVVIATQQMQFSVREKRMKNKKFCIRRKKGLEYECVQSRMKKDHEDNFLEMKKKKAITLIRIYQQNAP
jgi:hypothetical protein